MKAFANSFAIRQFQSLAIHTLRSERMALAVVPELRAKTVNNFSFCV